MSDNREAIERKAYEFWEADGRPDGRHDDHWARAEAMMAGSDDRSESLDDPVPKPATPPEPSTVDAAAPKAESAAKTSSSKASPAKGRKPASRPSPSQDTSLGPSDDLPVGRA